MRRLPFALVLLLLAPAVAAQVYKWTDANGTVHYSETPPPQGTQFKRISTSGIEQPAATPAPAKKAGTAPRPAATENATLPDTPENRAKLCSSLKANLDVLKGSNPVVMEQQGKPVALDEAQRSEQLAQAQAQYAQYCAQ
jgi:hypothetical protein